MRIENWNKLALDREARKSIAEQAKVHMGVVAPRGEV
jgi:hypothetical protein